MASEDELELDEIGGVEGARILNVREETERRAPRQAMLVSRVGWLLARPAVVLGLLAFHALWLLANLRVLAWYQPWDPYPFAFLATLASVLGPFVSLLILMRQERDAHISELRDEIALQVSLYDQRQLAASVQLLRDLAGHLDVRTRVSEASLENLVHPLRADRLMDEIREQLDRAEHEPHE